MFDALLLVTGGIMLGGGLVGMVRNLVQLVRVLRFRREMHARLESALMQEPQRVRYTCRACKKRREALFLPKGPICRDCWQALDAYLSEVA